MYNFLFASGYPCTEGISPQPQVEVQGVSHVRGVPDGQALPTPCVADLEHPVGVNVGEWGGGHGLPALDVGAEKQTRGGDQQPARLPRDRTEEVRLGRPDVGDSPDARIVRDDAHKVPTRVRGKYRTCA